MKYPLFKVIIKCSENEGIKLAKFMQIKTVYPNFIYGSDY